MLGQNPIFIMHFLCEFFKSDMDSCSDETILVALL